jgi:hypothetical protein
MESWQVVLIILAVVTVLMVFILLLDSLGVIPNSSEGMKAKLLKRTAKGGVQEHGNQAVYRLLYKGE